MNPKISMIFAIVAVVASVTESHKDFCPNFGEFNVKHQAFLIGKKIDTTMGVGGCFSKELVPNGGLGDNRFNLWLGTAATNESFCNRSSLSEKQFFQFSCISSWYPNNETGNKVLFIKLYDRAARHGRLAARCAVYEKLNEKYAVMQIALDDHPMCKNNGKKGIDPRFMTSPTKSNWTDEPVVLIMDIQEHTDVSRVVAIPVEKFAASTSSVDTLKTKGPKPPKQNSDQILAELMWNKFQMSLTYENKPVEQATLSQDKTMQLDRMLYQTKFRRAVKGFRFPEWAQGCWTNMCINGGVLIFEKSVLSEIDPDEIDYQQGTAHKNSKRNKRSPCFDSPTTPKPTASTTGPFPVKFKDEDYPLDGFRTNKRESNSDSEVVTSKVKMPLNAVEQLGDYVKKITDVVVSTISKRAKRSTDNFSKSTKTTWLNVMPINDDGSGNMGKFLITNNISLYNDEKKTDSRQKYWCLWLILKDHNIIEYTGIPAKIAPKDNEDLLSFGQELCQVNPRDG